VCTELAADEVVVVSGNTAQMTEHTSAANIARVVHMNFGAVTVLRCCVLLITLCETICE
jgi:hypothetical protein